MASGYDSFCFYFFFFSVILFTFLFSFADCLTLASKGSIGGTQSTYFCARFFRDWGLFYHNLFFSVKDLSLLQGKTECSVASEKETGKKKKSRIYLGAVGAVGESLFPGGSSRGTSLTLEKHKKRVDEGEW